jgi:hypothetical protein
MFMASEIDSINTEPFSDLEKKIGRRFPIVSMLIGSLIWFGTMAFLLPVVSSNPGVPASVQFLQTLAIGILGFLGGIVTGYFGNIALEKK